MISVVYIPGKGGESYTEFSRGRTPRPGCQREPVSGLGDAAYTETCPKDRGPIAYIKVGANDLIVQMDVNPPATAASIKPTFVAVAKAAVAKAR